MLIDVGKKLLENRMKVMWEGFGWWLIYSHGTAAIRFIQVPAFTATLWLFSLNLLLIALSTTTRLFLLLKQQALLHGLQFSVAGHAFFNAQSLYLPPWAFSTLSSISAPFQSFPLLSEEYQLFLLFVIHPFICALERSAFCFYFHQVLLFSLLHLQLFPLLCILCCLQTCSDLPRLEHIFIGLFYLHITALPFTRLLESVASIQHLYLIPNSPLNAPRWSS